MEQLSQGSKIKRFYELVKPNLMNGCWITSEQLYYRLSERIILQNNYNIATLLGLLYRKGYLDRTTAKRIYFSGKQEKNYNGKYAYRLKKEIIYPHGVQLDLFI